MTKPACTHKFRQIERPRFEVGRFSKDVFICYSIVCYKCGWMRMRKIRVIMQGLDVYE